MNIASPFMSEFHYHRRSCLWDRNPNYAHIEIVVAFLVVNFFGFLVITRNPTMHFGPKLEEIFLSASRSFLYLSGAFLKAINPSCLTPKFPEKIENLTTIYILA